MCQLPAWAEPDEDELERWHERVERYVCAMRGVQGDRRFRAWSGSVVDSVVGAFLTQNVNDHLSSSAFISLCRPACNMATCAI